MPVDAKPSFAFLVVTYNHQDYILDHLESIKYLVQTHGAEWDVDVIINDDFSRDQTRTLIDCWLALNGQLFRHVKTIYNSNNLGTCASVNNMLSHMVADRCKLTAGDDVYSFENIFELTKCTQDEAIIAGRTLYLRGGNLMCDRAANALDTATQVIYRHNTLLHRFKHFSYNNAPNLLYATECLMHPNVRAYLQRFDVVEDWPLQIAIAREFSNRRFVLIDKVLVYYRRTSGSTYIVANRRFIKDKLQVYDDLIEHESNFMEWLRLSSRRFCFKSQNRWVNKFLNMDAYFFIFSCIFNMFSIVKFQKSIKSSVDQHQRHYIKMQSLALRYKNL